MNKPDMPDARQSPGILPQMEGLDLPAINQLAAGLLQRGMPLAPVLAAYAEFRSRQPASANAAYNHAFYLARDGQAEAAIATYQRALELGVRDPQEVHLNLANLYLDQLHDPAAAERHLRKALSLTPDYAGAWYNLGNLAELKGERAEAAHCFERCLQLEPGNLTPLARLGEVHRFEDPDDPLLARMQAAARGSSNADLHFSLGRALDRLGNYLLAWQHFELGNALDRVRLPRYEPGQVEALVDALIARCDANWFESHAGKLDSGSTAGSPVFICGMFRSGTTLLEQVLGAHPALHAGGELEFFPRLVARNLPRFPAGLDSLDPERLALWRSEYTALATRLAGPKRRLIDKRPDNFLRVGLIKAVLPDARFVVSLRDWRDVAVSLFGTRLSASQNYASRLPDIRHYLGQHQRLVQHWAGIPGTDLSTLHYEELVRQPRAVLEPLLQKLGLDWDARCLAFAEKASPVRTASAWQVREPLHTRSIGRWRNYAAQFEAAFGALPED